MRFEAFQQARSVAEIRETVIRFPFIVSTDVIQIIERVIVQQVPLEQQSYFEKRLGWLRQIAQEQNQ